jgi:hypothetical protein
VRHERIPPHRYGQGDLNTDTYALEGGSIVVTSQTYRIDNEAGS